MRLIDADAYRFRPIEHDKRRYPIAYVEGFNVFSRALREAPTIDAVPVVRCKNCRYRNGTPGQPNIICGQMKDDDFCSYGEQIK